MSDPAQRERGLDGGADPTRDIRLPPLPDRPFPPLPSDWSVTGRSAETPAPVGAEQPPPPAPGEPTTPRSGPLVDQPTGGVGRPPEGARERTLTFEGTSAERWAAGHATAPDPAWSPVPPREGPVVGPRPRTAPARGRRWPWVVLTLIPLLVIVGAGVWLLLLLRAA